MTAPFLSVPIFYYPGAPAGQLFTYVANSTTPQVTYSDAAGSVPNTNPVILDTTGAAIVRLGTGLAYDFVLKDQTGTTTIWTANNYTQPLVSASITQASIGALLYPQTGAESSAGITPVNFAQQPQSLLRYKANTTPGTTDMLVGMQAAIDSASADSPNVNFGNAVVVSSPLLIRTGTQENISLAGSSRVSSAIGATAADIHTIAQGINCIIFNQNNNTHLHLRHFEFTCAAAFSGVCIYCVESGGTDSSGQCLFSSVFQDMWMGMPTTNAGFLKGGVQNCKFDTIEIEGCANAAYNLVGVGCQDVFFTNHSMVSCFDQFIQQTSDTNGSIQMTVNGLHAYNHGRGPLFQVQNWVESTIANVTLEVASSNLGTTGLFNFNNCTSLTVLNSKAIPRVGTGTCATVTIVSGTSQIQFTDGQWTGNIGALLNGAGVMDLIFENIDFSNCTTAGIECNGAFTGTIRTRNCKFNNQQGYGFVNQVAGAASWYSENDEFINAGLSGTAGFRNISISTSGTVVIKNPTIGQNNGSAAASVYVENSGTGPVTIINPTWLGAPPTNYINNTSSGSITVVIAPGFGGAISSATALTLPVNGDSVTVAGSTGITSITASLFNFPGRRITLVFTGTLTVTDGSNLKLNGNLSAVPNTSLTLVTTDATNWIELSRSIN